jgi:hypothetical protein
LAQGSYTETIEIITKPESELGQAYQTLKSLFDQTKKIYSQQNTFLSAEELNIRESEHREIIRLTNLATFGLSVFGGQEIGFYDLNDHFIETFTVHGEEFAKVPGELFVNLKTQMYLSTTSQEGQEKSKDDILFELFPAAFDHALQRRHPLTPLSQSELEFLAALNERRELLLNRSDGTDSIRKSQSSIQGLATNQVDALSEQFTWEDFLSAISKHLRIDYQPLIAPYMKRHALTAPNPSKIEFIVQSMEAIDSIEIDISSDMQRAVQATLQDLQSKRDQRQQPELISRKYHAIHNIMSNSLTLRKQNRHH